MLGEIMKFRIVVIATIGFELACTAFAGDDKYLVGKGYRWVTVDGPYACRTEEEVRRIVAGKFGRNYQASMDLHKISRYASDSGYLRCYRNTGNLWSNCRRTRWVDPTYVGRVGANVGIQPNHNNSGEPWTGYIQHESRKVERLHASHEAAKNDEKSAS
jgi:hypothetical protein